MTSYERALLIVNPVAGSGRGLRLGQQLRESLESRGVVCSVRVTSGEGDAQRWAQAAGSPEDGAPFDLIVAIGGDGTVSTIFLPRPVAAGRGSICLCPNWRGPEIVIIPDIQGKLLPGPDATDILQVIPAGNEMGRDIITQGDL